MAAAGLGRPARALTTSASSPVLAALPQFRLLPASAEHRLSDLPPAARPPRISPPPCHRSGYPPPWAALAAAASQLVPRLLNQGLQVLQAPPRRPSPRPARACSLQGWRALALPGRSDPLGHLLFSLETKISWACPKLSQVCLLFKENIQIPGGKPAPLGLLPGPCPARPEERRREIAGAFGGQADQCHGSWPCGCPGGGWDAGPGLSAPSLWPPRLLGPHLEPPQERSSPQHQHQRGAGPRGREEEPEGSSVLTEQRAASGDVGR